MSSAQTFSTAGSLMAVRLRGSNRHLVRALLSLASAALLLRVGGMLNQVVVSASFGAGATMDAYFASAAFPLLLVQLFSSAMEAAVIPVYSRLRMHSNREVASRLLSTLVNCLVLSAVILVLILIALRQPLVSFSAPGLDEPRLQQAIMLAPLLYLAIPLSLVIGLLECILNAEGQFGWPAYAGLLVPLTTAFLTLVGGKVWGIAALCIGGFCGTALQLIVVGIRAKQAHLRYHLIIDVHSPDLQLILYAAWPVLSGALITQASPLIDQIFASTLAAGSISALNYALKPVSIFIGVVFVSVGRALFPHLARQADLGDPGYLTFKGTLRLYLWGVGLCTLFFSLSLLVLGRPLIALLFQHGAFSSTGTRVTAIILSGFAPGLMPMAIGFLLSRAFNALGETRVPMYMALVNVGANALFDALFAHFWQGLGIALATSAVSLITSSLLLIFLHRRIGTLEIWHVPPEFQTFAAQLNFFRQEQQRKFRKHWPRWRFSLCHFCQALPYALATMIALAAGAIATARNALLTLRIGLGSLLLLCFLRYPFALLVAWASITIGIGSSLAVFNGNNLDTMLILPLLGLLVFLPWKEIIRRMPSLIWVALYLAWIMAGISLSPLDTRAFLTFWLTMLASVGVGALTIILITTRQRLCIVINVLLATALLAALYGLYGFVARQHGEVDPDTSLFRITSLFTQATTFAFYLALLLPLAFYRCLYTRGVFQLVSITAALCLLGALLLTFTRSAYVGVFLGMVIMACCLPVRRARAPLIGGLLFFSGIAFYLAWNGHLPLFARFFNEDTATLNGRVYLWQALLRNFQITRWFGCGLQASDQLLAYLHVGAAGQGVIGTAPHSLFLGTLYDHGVIGLLFLCIAFFSLGNSLLQGIWRSKGERRMLYAAALASLVTMLLQSLESSDFWIQAVGASFWIVVALPLARCWSGGRRTLFESQDEDACPPSGSSPGPGFLSLCQANKCVEEEV
ncbi:MAG TPA: O-antigen ligase family protein [Ktedonobacteraceae bacterium]|nr:O-antigen ligase family protein [Ktedonobacteraceae bacterium]